MSYAAGLRVAELPSFTSTTFPSVCRMCREIGRRFGNRDHTTVLLAIRKIDKEMTENPHLREEIEEFKRQLNR